MTADPSKSPPADAGQSQPTFHLYQQQNFGDVSIHGSNNNVQFLQTASTWDRSSQSTARFLSPHTKLSEELQQQVAEELERQVTEILCWPRALPSGSELSRPEHQKIEGLLDDADVDVIVLLGEGGSGKSALMATLGRSAQASGWRVVGMRLDRLPKYVENPEALREYLCLSVPFTDAVASLAQKERVLVLIDQLDALCDMMAAPTKRLSLVLNTVKELARISGVKVVLAARPFEYHYSVQLLGAKLKDIQLSLPKWEDVRPHIEAAGVNPETLSSELKEELTRPQVLNLFLARIQSGDVAENLTTYFAMRTTLWESEVVNAPNCSRLRQFLFDLVQYLANEEVLSRPLAQLDDWVKEVMTLNSAGWLMQTGTSSEWIGFRHQSLFDYVYVRWLIAESQDVTQTIIQNQRLSVRRRVQVILEYLRASEPEGARIQYLRTLKRLWREPRLRTHLKYLLIDFLGRVRNPMLEEIHIVRSAFGDNRFRTRTLLSTSLGTDWFVHLKDRELPEAMADPLLAGSCVGLLNGAPEGQASAVLSLLERHWLQSDEGAKRVAVVLMQRASWSSRAIELAKRCVIDIPFEQNHRHAVGWLCGSLAKSSPDAAMEIFTAGLKTEVSKRLDAYEQAMLRSAERQANVHSERSVRFGSTFSEHGTLRALICSSLHGTIVFELAKTAPRQFVDLVCPQVERVLALFATSRGLLPCFKDELFWDASDLDCDVFSILKALSSSIVAFAKRDADSFLCWVEKKRLCEFLTVQKLMLIGLSELAATHPTQIVEHLRSDPRRLLIGDGYASRSSAIGFVRVIASQFTAPQQQELAQLFRNWTPLHALPSEWNATLKRSYLDHVRRHRLQLLLCLDSSKLDRSTRVFIEGEQRAYPDLRPLKAKRVEARVIGSPMSARQMEHSSDESILNLFAELTDGSGLHHPRLELTGGSMAASGQLVELTKHDPARGLQIARRLEPKLHERPVGMVLQAAAEATTIDREKLFAEIVHHEQRGFCSPDYRWCVAYGLSSLGNRNQSGLPDSVCEMLRRWLVDSTGVGYQEDLSDKDQSFPRSILVPGGYGLDFPSGNYPILRALTVGYLCRTPPELTLWFQLLEQHLNRTENPQVWQALAPDALLWIDQVERVTATDFLRRLFAKCPELLNVSCGLNLVAHFQRWLPVELTRGWLDLLCHKESRWSAQAYGELLVVRAERLPSDSWSCSEIERWLRLDAATSQQVAAVHEGIALMSGLSVCDERLQGKATEWLQRLGTSRLPGVTAGLLSSFPFQEPLGYGPEIESVLRILVEQPHHLQHPHLEALFESLKVYVSFAPESVLAIAQHLVALNIQRQADGKLAASNHVTELVDLSITLQDLDGFVDAGLDLFDQLQTLNHPEVELALDEKRLLGSRPNRQHRRRA